MLTDAQAAEAVFLLALAKPISQLPDDIAAWQSRYAALLASQLPTQHHVLNAEPAKFGVQGGQT